MVTFLSERLQHKQRKTLKVLIAADSEANLWCYGRFRSEYLKIMIQDENLLFQIWLTRAQVSSWPRPIVSYGKHSSQKMEHQKAASYEESSFPSRWIILSCGPQHWDRPAATLLTRDSSTGGRELHAVAQESTVPWHTVTYHSRSWIIPSVWNCGAVNHKLVGTQHRTIFSSASWVAVIMTERI